MKHACARGVYTAWRVNRSSLATSRRSVVTAVRAEKVGTRHLQTPAWRQHTSSETSRWLGHDIAARRSLSRIANAPIRQVYVALGSNVGDSVANIEDACRQIDADGEMRVVDTSCLYRTKPMYVEDQADFINGACELETTLEPTQLLDRLQSIEQNLGRVKLIDKGPTNIDLDIIGYGDVRVSSERLTIPHALLHERAFVLRPLCDLRSGALWRLPSSGKTAIDQLADLQDDLQPFTISGKDILTPFDQKRRTRLMSILNITPDSFSDGGANYTTNIEALKKIVAAHITAGADIVDIGGQSSRPNAEDVSAEEEISRVLPAIKAIKSLPESSGISISVDTYRAAVAEAAIKAGAHIVNDVSSGLLDPDMLTTVARLGCTYIMMHMRGTPATMARRQNCTYAEGVIEGVASELDERLAEALEAGIRRWRIILDPGIGFAKDVQGNLQLLRHFNELSHCQAFRGIPWLAGSSKKRFVGTITGVKNAVDRNWGTAATVTAAIAGGADIVRVHDVEPMSKVIKMSDAIYR